MNNSSSAATASSIAQVKNRVRMACELWSKAFAANVTVLPQFDRWLANELRQHKQFGKRDRQFYSETLFLMLRHALFCCYAELRSQSKTLTLPDFLLSYDSSASIFQLIQKTDSRHILRWTATLAVDENPQSEWGEFVLAKDLEFLETLKQELANLPQQLAAKTLKHSIPYYFVPFLERRIALAHWTPSQIENWLNRQNKRPPLWIRLNAPTQHKTVTTELSEKGFLLNEYRQSYSLVGQSSLQKTESFQNGLFEIQDFASQEIGAAVPVQPKDWFVWDACAGGGGKTMQIAAMLQNKGAVYASDIRAHKLEDIKQRARRAGFFNVRTFEWNGEQTPTFSREITNRNGFDAVLVDAPCSSSGTWRRNPDAKYRFHPDELPSLNALQISLLTHASQAVRPNGSLIYATCSWLVEENEDVISKFLQTNTQFKLLSNRLAGLPEEIDADTMFVAVMQRSE